MSYGIEIYNSSGALKMSSDNRITHKLTTVSTYQPYLTSIVVSCPVSFPGQIVSIITRSYTFSGRNIIIVTSQGGPNVYLQGFTNEGPVTVTFLGI